jgi:hypothetical protein
LLTDNSQPSEAKKVLAKSYILATVGLQVWIFDSHTNAVIYKGKVGDKRMTQIDAKIFSIASRDTEYNLKDGLELAMSIGTLLNNEVGGGLHFVKVLKNTFGQFMT